MNDLTAFQNQMFLQYCNQGGFPFNGIGFPYKWESNSIYNIILFYHFLLELLLKKNHFFIKLDLLLVNQIINKT